jgi:hypothetical protein
MSTITERTARVARGYAFLSEHDDPGWYRADAEPPVDLGKLDIGSTENCVLGQRCPPEALADAAGAEDPDMLTEADWDEAYAVNATRLLPPFTALDTWALAHGFTGAADEMDALTAEWRRVITGRREAGD